MQHHNSQKLNLKRPLSFTSPKSAFGGDYHRFDADSDRGKPNQDDDQVVVVKNPSAAVEKSTSDGLTVEGIIVNVWSIYDENERDWKSHASAIAQSIHLIKTRLRGTKGNTNNSSRIFYYSVLEQYLGFRIADATNVSRSMFRKS
ncbi:unnamed protein product [Fraxinus pennsylvanica]|uniref:Uncharacterized protein n=1 Tax=Fraxinus pennsylvanica TaxID=56036 RepID=A0AAD1Z1A8_9LAMI|nr:unnamed protein product [Fraxinus pennsylvanica]